MTILWRESERENLKYFLNVSGMQTGAFLRWSDLMVELSGVNEII